jgi:hypothetical protein
MFLISNKMIEETIDSQHASKKSKIRPNPLHEEINGEEIIPETKQKTSSKKSHHLDHQKENISDNGTPKLIHVESLSPSKETLQVVEDKEHNLHSEGTKTDFVSKTTEEHSLPKELDSPAKNVIDSVFNDTKTSASKPIRSHMKLSSKSRSKSRSKTATKKNKWKEEAEKKEAENFDKEKENEEVVKPSKTEIVEMTVISKEGVENGNEKENNVDSSVINV